MKMTADQFMATISALGMDQDDAASLFGVDVRSVKRWRYKERKVPPTVVNFLAYLIATKTDGPTALARLGRAK